MTDEKENIVQVITTPFIATAFAVILGYGILFLEISILDSSIHKALIMSFLVSGLGTSIFVSHAKDALKINERDNNGE